MLKCHVVTCLRFFSACPFELVAGSGEETHLRGIGNFTSSYGQIRQNFLPIPKYVLELCTLKLERSRGDFYYMRGLRVWAKKIA